MRYSSRALIIKDKKLLLVTGYGANYYWTPGGSMEEGESAEQALHRELQEELSTKIVRAELFMTFRYSTQLVKAFIVEISSDFKATNEITDFVWYKRGDDIRLSGRLRHKLIPELIRRGLI